MALAERARLRAILTPASLDELRRFWTLRDNRYAIRRVGGITRPVSPSEEAAIREHRLREAALLPSVMREIAIREAAAWHPPRVVAK